MRVFHFIKEKYGLKSIKERHLKIARIMELNDPFEFLGVELSNPQLRKAMNSMKKNMSKENGILCFSKSWSNPVLWSHYAEEHKGICMGFEIPDKNLTKVEYIDERFSVGNEINIEVMKKILATKFKHWAYEQEYRSFISLDDEEEKNGLYFLDFSDDLQLKQVIVGMRSNLSQKQISEALGDLAQNVEVFNTREAFKSFDVVKNKIWA